MFHSIYMYTHTLHVIEKRISKDGTNNRPLKYKSAEIIGHLIDTVNILNMTAKLNPFEIRNVTPLK